MCSLLATLKIVSVKMVKLEDTVEAKNKAAFLLWNGFQRLSLLTVIFLFAFDDANILGLSMNFNWNNFFVGLGIGSALLFPSVAFVSFISRKIQRKLRRTKTSDELERKKALIKLLIPKNELELVVWVVYVSFFSAAFSEEIIFRGFLQNHLENITGSLILAAVLQALIFGVGHIELGLKGIVHAALTGIILSFVFVFSGTLLAAILMHFLIDSTSFLDLYNARRKGQLDKVLDKFL